MGRGRGALLAAVSFVGILALGAAAQVTREEFDELKQQVEALQAQVAELRLELTELREAARAEAEPAMPERPTVSTEAPPVPVPEERADVDVSPPREWTSEKRTVTAATPDGEQEKEITYHKNTIGMEFVKISAGEFMMGSPGSEAERGSDEGPQHRVQITSPFYIGVHEVAQARYESVMGKNPARSKAASNPVELVSWDDAVEFCRRLSQQEGLTYRLPTEAEWEYACRAGTATPFHTGETISTQLANYDGDHTYGSGKKGVDRGETTAVGRFPTNPWGLHDMHGNLWEWCQDFHGDYYYTGSPVQDPRGPANGSGRVLRGGSWASPTNDCRSANRDRHDPSRPDHRIGFRVVMLPE